VLKEFSSVDRPLCFKVHDTIVDSILLTSCYVMVFQPSAEELLAIMEGKSIHPAAESFHHIQKINAHLSSLALQAPVLATALLQARQNQASTAQTERVRVRRLMSEPGEMSHGDSVDSSLQPPRRGQLESNIKSSHSVPYWEVVLFRRSQMCFWRLF